VKRIPQGRQAGGLIRCRELGLIEQMCDQRKILAPPPAVLAHQSLDDASGWCCLVFLGRHM
jgi:hypothetical protein